ncbi:MAG: Hsp20/alpha crystallin family protein [Candidatus Izemoplasmatales bacterium]|jgi:HSP20 family molecular chaperone IbpA|nr:Hsp20/alpha crystallin family protein [Candidatus Izemoplasmatales bacterium]
MNNVVKRNNDFFYFDNFFDGFLTKPLSKTNSSCMKTDIQELESGYSLDIDVPGYGKEEIKISLDNGYLTVEANQEEVKEEEKRHYLRRERFIGSLARSFYVGDGISESDIKASYDKGILKLFIPKQGTNIKEKKYISIE